MTNCRTRAFLLLFGGVLVLFDAFLWIRGQYRLAFPLLAFLLTLPALIVFEWRRSGARELAAIAVMTGISVVGRVLFASEDAGRFIFYLAPVVPVMFLDHITDAALKGIGEQVAVMWINIADSALTVLLILVLLPRFGIVGYILMIALTEVFNFALSLARLAQKTGYRPSLRRIFPPLSFALLSLLFSRVVLAPGIGSVRSLALGGAAGLALYLLPFLLFPRRAKNAPRP